MSVSMREWLKQGKKQKEEKFENALILNNNERDCAEKKHLYIIHQKDTTLYKIGVSNNINSRLSSLQTANPNDLEIILIFKNGQDYEYRLHGLLNKYNIKNEWFDLSIERLLKIILELYNKEIIEDRLTIEYQELINENKRLRMELEMYRNLIIDEVE